MEKIMFLGGRERMRRMFHFLERRSKKRGCTFGSFNHNERENGLSSFFVLRIKLQIDNQWLFGRGALVP